jgi:hypothetical protein
LGTVDRSCGAWLRAGIGCLFVALTTLAWAEKGPNATSPLSEAELAPELRKCAEENGVPLDGFTPGDEPKVGDTVVFWVGSSRGAQRKQWLLQLRRGQLTPSEQTRKPRTMIKYLSWGSTVKFVSAWEAIDLWIAGPVDVTRADRKPQQNVAVERARVLVPVEFLRIGFDRSARTNIELAQTIKRLTDAGVKLDFGLFYMLDKPVDVRAVPAAKELAHKLEFTPDKERAWAGGSIALQGFYELAVGLPELRDIVMNAVDKPSPLQLAAAAFGPDVRVTMDLNVVHLDVAKAALLPVDSPAFEQKFTLSMGKAPLVHSGAGVTAARAPLDVSGGIIMFFAVHPKDLGRVVHALAIAARPGAAP